MHETLKDLLVVFVISVPTFMLVKPAFSGLLTAQEFARSRNLWLALTLIVFLSHNFWLLILLCVIAITLAQFLDQDRVSLYFLLLLVVPPVWDKIPGLGFMDQLFTLNPKRLLELVILLPAFIALLGQEDELPFGRSLTDKLITGYILLTLALQIRGTTLTDTLREGFYIFLDIFLPYYVISRSVRHAGQFRKAFSSFVIAALLLSSSAIYEYASHHLLYSSMGHSIGANLEMSNYLMRGSSLRALATTGQPIALGFAIMVGLGFYLFLRRHMPNASAKLLLIALLSGGLFASLSRGPWVGMALLLLLFFWLGPNARKNMTWLMLAVFSAFALALVLPGGEKIINLLPFIGKTDTFNVSYRENLFTHALSVIQQNPMLGSVSFRSAPELQAMKQGEGIIDIVNSYLEVVLEYGVIGLGLFSGIFISILLGIYKTLRRFRSQNVQRYLFGAVFYGTGELALDDEYYLLGVTLFAVLLAILLTIYTVSSITVIPTIYWAMAGMGAAYMRMNPSGANSCD